MSKKIPTTPQQGSRQHALLCEMARRPSKWILYHNSDTTTTQADIVDDVSRLRAKRWPIEHKMDRPSGLSAYRIAPETWKTLKQRVTRFW